MQTNYYDTAIEDEREFTWKGIIRKDNHNNSDSTKSGGDDPSTQNEESKDNKNEGPRRSDRYNQEIKFGQKRHKLTFVDQVEQKPIA